MLKDKKWVEKVINIVLNVFIFLFGILLLISIYNNIQTKLMKKSYADFFGFSMFEVQTGSMADEINPGDWIIVKNTNKLKLNDIITYKFGEEYITHRIIEVYNGIYVTKGDANNAKDEPITEEQVVGKVVKILPHFGIFKKTILNPTVLISLIITIGLCNFAFKKKKITINKKTIDIEKIKEVLVKPIKIKEKVLDSSVNVSKKEKVEEKKQVEEKNEYIEELKALEQDDDFKYIAVDASEIDDTFLEIAENEFEEDKVEEVKKEIIIEEEQPKKQNKINLELLENSSSKKSKNIIDKIITIKIEELNEIVNILQDGSKLQVNEPTIKNKFIEFYIESRYYNYYGENIESGSKKTKIDKYLKEMASNLKQYYSGSDSKYSLKVDKFMEMFILISKLEQARDTIEDSKARIEFYKKEILKFAKFKNWDNINIKQVISDIMKTQRNYVGIIEYLFKKLETNMFDLNINKLASRKKLYGVSLEHNIHFSNIYSDYIIDKTYSEGVIAEDKMTITLNLLSVEIIKDMISSSFDRKYIISVPRSLHSKEKKFEKILKLIDDEYAKEAVVLLVSYEDLIKYKTKIKKIFKEGYKFAVSIGKETKIEEKNISNLSFVEFIFVDKKITNVVKKMSILPDELMEKVVYEDISKEVGDFGGE